MLLTTDYDILMAAGGDGTINQVANELIKQDAPSETCLAIIPLGTANDFATSLTIRDNDLVSAMQTAVKGKAIKSLRFMITCKQKIVTWNS